MTPTIINMHIYNTGYSHAVIKYDLGEHKTNNTPQHSAVVYPIEDEYRLVLKMAEEFIKYISPNVVEPEIPTIESLDAEPEINAYGADDHATPLYIAEPLNQPA